MYNFGEVFNNIELNFKLVYIFYAVKKTAHRNLVNLLIKLYKIRILEVAIAKCQRAKYELWNEF